MVAASVGCDERNDMFEKSRYRKAMSDLGTWVDANSTHMHGFEMVDTAPAPMLIFSSGESVVFVTVKDAQYTLCLDDASAPGSIPSWQVLGPLSTPPDHVIERLVSTLIWYIDEAGRNGNLDREVRFSGALRWVGKGLKLVEVETRGFYTVLKDALAKEPDNPTTLNGLYEASKRLGLPQTTVVICFEQGLAAQRAIVSEDTRFDFQDVVQYYTRTLEMADAIGMSREETMLKHCIFRIAQLEGM
jgi:hypothetical protein